MCAARRHNSSCSPPSVSPPPVRAASPSLALAAHRSRASKSVSMQWATREKMAAEDANADGVASTCCVLVRSLHQSAHVWRVCMPRAPAEERMARSVECGSARHAGHARVLHRASYTLAESLRTYVSRGSAERKTSVAFGHRKRPRREASCSSPTRKCATARRGAVGKSASSAARGANGKSSRSRPSATRPPSPLTSTILRFEASSASGGAASAPPPKVQSSKCASASIIPVPDVPDVKYSSFEGQPAGLTKACSNADHDTHTSRECFVPSARAAATPRIIEPTPCPRPGPRHTKARPPSAIFYG